MCGNTYLSLFTFVSERIWFLFGSSSQTHPPPPHPTPTIPDPDGVACFSTQFLVERAKNVLFQTSFRKMWRNHKKRDQRTTRMLHPFLLAKLMRNTDEAESGWHTMRRILPLYLLPEEKKHAHIKVKHSLLPLFWSFEIPPHPPPHFSSPNTFPTIAGFDGPGRQHPILTP